MVLFVAVQRPSGTAHLARCPGQPWAMFSILVPRLHPPTLLQPSRALVASPWRSRSRRAPCTSWQSTVQLPTGCTRSMCLYCPAPRAVQAAAAVVQQAAAQVAVQGQGPEVRPGRRASLGNLYFVLPRTSCGTASSWGARTTAGGSWSRSSLVGYRAGAAGKGGGRACVWLGRQHAVVERCCAVRRRATGVVTAGCVIAATSLPNTSMWSPPR